MINSDNKHEVTFELPWGKEPGKVPHREVPSQAMAEESDLISRRPAIPRWRIGANGKIQVINELERFGFLPEGKLRWFQLERTGEPMAYAESSQVDFLFSGNELVDFYILQGMEILLLIHSDIDANHSELIMLNRDGVVLWKSSPPKGFTGERILPIDGGMMGLVLNSEEELRIAEFDLKTGGWESSRRLNIGTKGAMAAYYAPIFFVKWYDPNDFVQVQAPGQMSEALVTVFGMDRMERIYALVEGKVVVFNFKGGLILTIKPKFANFEPLPAVFWRVDSDGKVFYPDSDGKVFRVRVLPLKNKE